MDLSKIREKLTQLKSGSGGGNKSLFKPKPGKTVVRILPNKHQDDFPFVELKFHYEVAKGSVLSPEVFGERDPINEFAEKLKNTGSKEDFAMGRKIEAKERIYVPILVRGEEADGVKFWGFGKTIYEQLLSIMDDSDYGDITDLKNGRDVTITYTAATSENSFPDIQILPKPSTSKVTENPDVAKAIKEMIDVKTLFKRMSYDELKRKLEAFLDPDNEGEITETPKSSASKSSPAETDAELDDIFETKPAKAAAAAKNVEAPSAGMKGTNLDSLDADFDNLFD